MKEGDVFLFSKATNFDYQGPELKSVKYFLNVLTRDKNKVFKSGNGKRATTIRFILDKKNSCHLKTEQYGIRYSDNLTRMEVISSDELGLIYGMLHVSEEFLGVDKFWFWNDCEPATKEVVRVHPVNFLSPVPYVKFRGWFINDEVLLSTWKYNHSDTYVWEMAFEALLRCRGNTVIPGTDIKNPVYRDIARDMGLWVTHHHAEPLGAPVFARVFPHKKASYIENGDLFKRLWHKAIIEQQKDKVIWNIGFRGQGDRPFWVDDPTFDTDEKRGELISTIMRDQYELILKYQKDPVCCVNLYGEIAELYKKGLLALPGEVIKIWADNGYGKMVSRRQGDHNPRIPSIPSPRDKGPHGIYYHVTFYDLQASNHLTMLPNDMSFVNEELGQAFDRGMTEVLIVNCGNIRPHLYFLDFISQRWSRGKMDPDQFRNDYVSRYYPSHVDDVSTCIDEYFNSVIQYGTHDDERAGEQFYHYTLRNLAYRWITSQGKESAKELYWATGKADLKDQMNWFKNKAGRKIPQWISLTESLKAIVADASSIEQKRMNEQLLVQVLIHKNGCQALYCFTHAFEKFLNEAYLDAYVLVNRAMTEIKETIDMLQNPSNEKWRGFYDNDCLTNVSLTFYTLETVRRYLRMVGDGPTFYNWEKRYVLDEGERSVELLTHKSKQLMDDELAKKLAENGVDIHVN